MLIGSRATGPFAAPVNYNTPGFGGDINIPTVPMTDLGMPAGGMAAAPAKTGILDRIGAFLKSDEGRATLLRSAAATLQGGLPAGIQAGANYADGRKASAAKSQQQGFENAMATRGADLADLRQQQGDDLGWAGVDVNLRELGERTRAAKASEGIQTRGQNVTIRGQDTSRANNTDNNRTSIITNDADNATSRANNQATVGAQIYGTNVGYMAEGQRAAAGIGSKNAPYTETRVEVPAVAGADSWFGGSTPASPKTTTVTRIPMAPAAAAAAPSQAVQALKANPNLRGQFEAKYGPGSASQYLGGR